MFSENIAGSGRIVMRPSLGRGVVSLNFTVRGFTVLRPTPMTLDARFALTHVTLLPRVLGNVLMNAARSTTNAAPNGGRCILMCALSSFVVDGGTHADVVVGYSTEKI